MSDESLFSTLAPKRPLPYRIRPRTLDEIVGHEDQIGPDAPIGKLLRGSGPYPNLILEGPPGSGKTSIAQALARTIKAEFVSLNATSDGIPRIREVVKQATDLRKNGRGTIVFIDEGHRLNRTQMDALLPHFESGLFIGVLASTEPAGFAFPNALLSRASIMRLARLESQDLERLVDRACSHPDGLERDRESISQDGLAQLTTLSRGDARRLLLTLEAADQIADQEPVNAQVVQEAAGSDTLRYDGANERYRLLSWYQKAVRGSDPDAAVLALARLVEGGEDPRVIVRRLLVIASEDIGMADTQGLVMAEAVAQAVERIGFPEAAIPLAHATIYLANAPKSNSAYKALEKAREIVQSGRDIRVPKEFLNPVTKDDRNQGIGEDYRYPFEDPSHVTHASYLARDMREVSLWRPSGFGDDRRRFPDGDGG